MPNTPDVPRLRPCGATIPMSVPQPTTCSSRTKPVIAVRTSHSVRPREIRPVRQCLVDEGLLAGRDGRLRGHGARLLRSLGTCDPEAIRRSDLRRRPQARRGRRAARSHSLALIREIPHPGEVRADVRDRPPPRRRRPGTAARPPRRHRAGAHLAGPRRPARRPLRLSRGDDAGLHDAGLRLPRLAHALAPGITCSGSRRTAGEAREFRERDVSPSRCSPTRQAVLSVRRLRREEALRQDRRR